MSKLIRDFPRFVHCEVLAEGTTQFLDAQIKSTRAQIIEKESELRAMRENAGAQPISDADLLPYEVLKETYKTLLVNRQQAMISANLERRQIGEQFKVALTPDGMSLRKTDLTRASQRPPGGARRRPIELTKNTCLRFCSGHTGPHRREACLSIQPAFPLTVVVSDESAACRRRQHRSLQRARGLSPFLVFVWRS